MAIDDFTFTADEVQARLHALFEAGKARDEFEFGCTLLRVRGMESAGWDPFVETSRLVEDLLSLSAAPLVGRTKVRLGLLLYSHLTEVGAIYDVLANLTRVIAGERYTMYPFLDLARNRKGEGQFLSTPATVRGLQEMLQGRATPGLVEVVDWFFYSPVRNAFAHADYTLHQDKFRSSDWFEVGGIRTRELPLDTLLDLFNRALAFYATFMGRVRRAATQLPDEQGRPRPLHRRPRPRTDRVAGRRRAGLYSFHAPPGGASAEYRTGAGHGRRAAAPGRRASHRAHDLLHVPHLSTTTNPRGATRRVDSGSPGLAQYGQVVIGPPIRVPSLAQRSRSLPDSRVAVRLVADP